MAANIDPIFPLKPRAAWGDLAAANTAKDGTGVVLTLGPVSADGGFLRDIRFLHKGTNVPTVARLFLNNGSSNAVAANNALWYEISIAAGTLSETSQQDPYVIPLNREIPGGHQILVTLGTAVAAGIKATLTWGDYS